MLALDNRISEYSDSLYFKLDNISGIKESANIDGASEIDSAAAEKLKKGVWFAEGKTSSESVRILRSGVKESLIEIIIRQGLSRQVSRMLAKVGLSFKSLKRTKIGKLDDKDVGIGKFRTLTKPEIAYLNKVTSSRQKLDK